MEKAGIPFFKKADLDASIGVFFDGFSNVHFLFIIQQILLNAVNLLCCLSPRGIICNTDWMNKIKL